MKRALLLAAATFLFACVPAVVRPPVTYVPTATPGVIYIVVHPTAEVSAKPFGNRSGDVDGYSRVSEYILRCDGRGPKGMDCRIVTEIALDRASIAPLPSSDAARIDTEVGGLGRNPPIEVIEKKEAGK